MRLPSRRDRNTYGIAKEQHRASGPLLAAALCLGAMLLPASAQALTTLEATKVADLIAALQPSLGPFAYDEEIARDWYERDAEDRAMIQAAGFTAESWEVAVGETFRGLIALVPQSEVDALRAKLDSSMDGFTQLSEVEKAEVRQEYETEFLRMQGLRAEGADFVDIVRPVAPRLNAIIQSMEE